MVLRKPMICELGPVETSQQEEGALGMTAIIYQIRDYHLKRLERDGKEILAQAIDYRELAKLGGPIIDGSISYDVWAERHSHLLDGLYHPDGDQVS